MSDNKNGNQPKQSGNTEKRTNLNDYNRYREGSKIPNSGSNKKSTSGTGPRDKKG